MAAAEKTESSSSLKTNSYWRLELGRLFHWRSELSSSITTEIERWAYAFWLGSCKGNNMVLALGYTSYFDASMNSAQDEMVVAGYLATLDQWIQFEAAWKLTLIQYDVPFFKMSEFIGRRKEYSHPKWQSETYRAHFIKDLASIIRDWTEASVACRMKQELFDRYNALYEIDSRFNLFAFCGRDCAAQVRKYIRAKPPALPIAFIFDQGDANAGLLVNEMISSGLPAPSFKRSRPDPMLDLDDPYHVQLQACDLAAWELRRGESDLEEGKLPEKLRKSLLALNHRNKIWKQTLEPDLEGLIRSAGIAKRT
jgi:hypothetical protein